MADPNGPFGDVIPSVRGSAQAMDATYIAAQLTTLYTSLGVVPGPPGSGAIDISYYTTLVQKTGGWFNDGTTGGNNAGYWVGRITSDVQKGGGSGASGSSGVSAAGVQGGGSNGALVNKQLSLLEDDIVYRLSLLAVNVLQPLKDKYPNIVVVSGFRQVNTGISQHELGEAVDLQIQNQTPEQLYTAADYIQKFLNFDQLILNWSDIGDGQGWIHVSFSPTSLRAQVLTKDFADTFHEGLFLCQPLSGEAAAAALRDQATNDADVLSDLETIQARQARLGTSAVANTATTTTPGIDGAKPGPLGGVTPGVGNSNNAVDGQITGSGFGLS